MNKKGSIILEAMLGIVVLSMVVLSIIPMLSFLSKRTVRSKFESKAGFLLQEGIESTYNIFMSNWTAYPDGNYHPVISSGGRWALLNGPQNNLETVYTRTVSVKKACRNQSGDIMPIEGTCTGLQDQNSKIITASISWLENGETKTLDAKYLLVNLMPSPAPTN